MALKTGEQAAQAAAQAQQQQGNYVDRLWMKAGSQTEITFLDGVLVNGQLQAPPCRHEHQLQRNGHWRNYYSCLAETGACPICMAGFKSAFMSYFTIIDHTQYKDRQGRQHFATKRLFACKPPTLQILNVVAANAGGLAGRRFSVHRPDNQAANVGSIFTFKQAYSGLQQFAQVLAQEGAQFQPQDLKPYNYHDVITEQTEQELQQIIGTNQPQQQGQYPQQQQQQQQQYPQQGQQQQQYPQQGQGAVQPQYPQSTQQGPAPQQQQYPQQNPPQQQQSHGANIHFDDDIPF